MPCRASSAVSSGSAAAADPPRGASLTHSAKSRAGFLSALYCFFCFLRSKATLQTKVQKVLHALQDFPTAVLALDTFLRRDTPSVAERACLAQACFHVLRDMCPALDVADENVLEHSRILFTYLLTEPLDEDGSILVDGSTAVSVEAVEEHSLLCDLSDERLVDPVQVLRSDILKGGDSKAGTPTATAGATPGSGRKRKAESSDDEADSGDDRPEFERAKCVPVSLLNHTYPVLAKALWCHASPSSPMLAS
jgi:hypothetical protein